MGVPNKIKHLPNKHSAEKKEEESQTQRNSREYLPRSKADDLVKMRQLVAN